MKLYKQPVKFVLFTLSVAILIISAGAQKVTAHSGGLNAQGCHAGSKPYHCHRSQNSGKSKVILKNPTHFECYDPNFGSVTHNFVVDRDKVFVEVGANFDPKKSYVNASPYWGYYGKGKFIHKLSSNLTKQCKKTNRVVRRVPTDKNSSNSETIAKPKLVSESKAISLCKGTMLYSPKMPKRKNYTTLTRGEFKTSSYDKRYGYVVVEILRKGWFGERLQLVICQIHLTEHRGFVLDVTDTYNGEIDYKISDWYKIKRRDLIK